VTGPVYSRVVTCPPAVSQSKLPTTQNPELQHGLLPPCPVGHADPQIASQAPPGPS
jgi:hypothetical protein